jgi:hypothetical protein
MDATTYANILFSGAFVIYLVGVILVDLYEGEFASGRGERRGRGDWGRRRGQEMVRDPGAFTEVLALCPRRGTAVGRAEGTGGVRGGTVADRSRFWVCGGRRCAGNEGTGTGIARYLIWATRTTRTTMARMGSGRRGRRGRGGKRACYSLLRFVVRYIIPS